MWAIGRLAFFRLILLFHFVFRVAGNAEGDALNALKTNLVDPNNVLQSWDPTLVNPCTWFHVTCNSENSVTRVDLGNANLTGQLVSQLGQLSNLQYLSLKHATLESLGIGGPFSPAYASEQNSLSGTIPMPLTTIASLQVLDLSSNKLTGDVPVNGSFSLFTPISFKNNLLNNPPPSPPPPLPPSTPTSSGNSATGAIAGGVAAGAALLFAAPAIAIAYWRRRKPQDHFFDVPAEEDPEVHLGQLKRFSLRELQVATDYFSNKNILGRGGFGKVYKGRLADGSLVAVKRLKEERTQGGELQFQTEVEMISMAVHRNLLRLRGFCMTPTERLLVYPFMVNGSVASCLRERQESQPPLDWPKRKQIALEFEAVVGDFGLAKLMDYKDTHVTTAVRGTIGHIAPEYLSTGKSSEKTDVLGERASERKRLETLVDGDLQGNYDNDEVEQLIQVALLCTQSSQWKDPRCLKWAFLKFRF
ncbi:hypothetical protein GH714_018244 [Hevea brasiliensis]|uniref:Protein kinase domain-containing protein n=1 Tax=Hevea brasiliensis TaxID=3981 RepID=A0A6A6NC98_HEVBR|nr:hypothetical protein GH714_018244 [Hevea brasiliensis]